MSRRDMPARSTRGKRMNALVGDEALVDEEFWKMDLFKDEEGDEEYKSEEEEEDVVDADFDNPEEKEEEGEAEVEKEKPDKKKRKAYVDPKAKKPSKRAKVDSETPKKEDGENISETDEAAKEPRKRLKREAKKEPKKEAKEGDATPPSTPSSPPSTPATTRKSTRTVVLQREQEREKERAEVEKKKSTRPKKRSPVIVRRITQEELLEEAKITEQINTESLKYILSLEEEKKKVKEAPTIVGPVVTYYSKDGKTCVCFDELPPVLTQTETAPHPTPPPREVCPITGLPAKYRDPKTGMCYANMEAFKILRERYLQREDAKCNAKLAQLNAMLQESKRKKDGLQKTPLPSGGFVAVL